MEISTVFIVLLLTVGAVQGIIYGGILFQSNTHNKVDNKTFEGFFYREDVRIRQGKINTQSGTIYGALVSGDNSGDYNTAFYYKDGKLYGSTHALKRDFLAVWTATKKSN